MGRRLIMSNMDMVPRDEIDTLSSGNVLEVPTFEIVYLKRFLIS